MAYVKLEYEDFVVLQTILAEIESNSVPTDKLRDNEREVYFKINKILKLMQEKRELEDKALNVLSKNPAFVIKGAPTNRYKSPREARGKALQS